MTLTRKEEKIWGIQTAIQDVVRRHDLRSANDVHKHVGGCRADVLDAVKDLLDCDALRKDDRGVFFLTKDGSS